MKKFELVKNYMATNLITFKTDTSIMEAIDVILQNSISGAPVLDSDGRLVGVLSEKDCLKIVMQGVYNEGPSGNGKVAEFMSTEVKTISDRMDVVEAAYEFIHSYYRRFPVVNDKGQLVGQISRRDVLRALNKVSTKERIIPASWVGREPDRYQTKR